MALQIPIRKLHTQITSYYPLSVLEACLSTHPINVANNIGLYKKGDVITTETSLDTILKNILEYETPEKPVLTPLDIFKLINEYTAFEVYANDEPIHAGTVDPVTNIAYEVDVPIQMTQLIQLRDMRPKDHQNVIIDWGDGTIINFSECEDDGYDKVGQGTGYCEYGEGENEYMHFCWHTYSEPGRYIVKVYGNTYWGLRCDYPQYNLISRVFDWDLPLARWCVNICNYARGSLKLQQINLPNYYNISHIQNTTHAFENCFNLVKVKNFRKNQWNTNSYAINSIFQNCNNLKTSDMRIAGGGPIPATCNYHFYAHCRNLETDVLNLLPDCGFSGRIINMEYVFYNCDKLTCSDYNKLAEMLWDDNTVKWLNTSGCFTGCSSLDLSKIPTSWGGTKEV